MEWEGFEASLIPLSKQEQENRRFYQWRNNPSQFSDEEQSEIRQHILQIRHPFFRNYWLHGCTDEVDHLYAEKFFSHNVFSGICVSRHSRYIAPILHSHDFFEIPYVLSGACVQTLDGKQYPLKQGDFCIMAPNSVHMLDAHTDDALIINILIQIETFDSLFMQILTDDSPLSRFFQNSLYGKIDIKQIIFETGDDPVIRDLMLRMLFEAQSRSKFAEQMMTGLLTVLLVHLMRNHSSHALAADGLLQKEKNFIVILSYIQEHYKGLTLQEVAAHFSYSPSHLSRMIKKYTGQSFTEIVKLRRLHHAAQMLESSRLSTEQISEQVGFSDLSHFYRSFKQYYGKSPVQYRRSLTME